MKIETFPYPDMPPAQGSARFKAEMGAGLMAFLLAELLRLLGVVFASKAEREAYRARAFRVRAAVRDSEAWALREVQNQEVFTEWCGATGRYWRAHMGTLWIWTARQNLGVRVWTVRNGLCCAPIQALCGLAVWPLSKGPPHAPP